MAEPGDRTPRTSVRDVVAQAWWAAIGRPTRSLLTAAGVGLGIAATIATVGVTGSAAAAISDRFDALEATQVTVRYPENLPRPPVSTASRVRQLNGVTTAGLLCQTRADNNRASAVSARIAGGATVRLNLLAAQPAALAASDVRFFSGRGFDDGHGGRGEPVAVIDAVAARDLHLADAPGKIVYVNGRPVTVVGVFQAPAGASNLTAVVIVPYEVCQRDAVGPSSEFRPADVVIRTRLGAAEQVSREALVAVEPTRPTALVAMVPPQLASFRQGVEADTRALFLGLALVSLVIGALGVSNTTLVSVLERRAEIGLRRAVGASRRAVAAQFLLESGLLGLVGGVLGTLIAVDITAVVALAKGWLVVLPSGLVAAGPVLGVVVGTLAGGYPAWSASRVTPADTLRR